MPDVVGLESEKASFWAVCSIVDVIILAQLEKHKTAYNTESLKPKHHYMFDVACQWLYQEVLVDALVIERLHLRVKVVAELVRNTETFERSSLASLINSHCQLLQDEKFGDGLVGRCCPLPLAIVVCS